MDEDEDATPFWLQTTHSNRRLRRQSSSLLLNSGILLIFLVLLAFAIVSVVLPPLVSFSSQIFRPHLVKRGWDSLNLVLVLFAIVCGFLSRNFSDGRGAAADDGSSYTDDYYKFSSTPKYGQLQRSNSSISRQWYDRYSDRTPTNRIRSSSSYPDLRQEPWTVNGSDGRWAFHDDTRLYAASRFPSSDLLYRHRREGPEEERGGGFGSLEEIGDGNGLLNTEPEQRAAVAPPESSSPPPFEEPEPAADQPPPPPATPPPPKVLRRKPKRAFQDLPANEDASPLTRSQPDSTPVTSTFPRPSPPPPPPPPPHDFLSEKRGKSQKKRGSATKEFLISLRRKKKKQRQKSVESLDAFFNLDATLPVALYPPPPPPSPPPPPLFHNVFSSKKSKDNRPPLEARALVTTQKGSLPVSITRLSNAEENNDSGNEWPSIPIPPPPPPPPFKMPPWKFEVHGDFVRLMSFKSSRSGSLDLDDDASSPSSSGSRVAADGVDPSTTLFCPSPDVNAKADKFIERFRAGLKLEKVNSVKDKQQRKGRSNLGPGRVRDPGQET